MSQLLDSTCVIANVTNQFTPDRMFAVIYNSRMIMVEAVKLGSAILFEGYP